MELRVNIAYCCQHFANRSLFKMSCTICCNYQLYLLYQVNIPLSGHISLKSRVDI